MKYLLPILLLSACGPAESHCITELGVNIISMVNGGSITEDGYSCEDFNAVERELISLLPNNPATNIDWSRVKNYNVWLHAGGKFPMWWGQKVAGYTFCPFTEIQIGIYPPHAARSNYGHELLHAAQGCNSPPLSDIKEADRTKLDDADHSNWTRDQFWLTINTVASWH